MRADQIPAEGQTARLRLEQPAKTEWINASIARRAWVRKAGVDFAEHCPHDLFRAATQEADRAPSVPPEFAGGYWRQAATPPASPLPRCYPSHVITQAVPIGQPARRIDFTKGDLTSLHIRSMVREAHKDALTPRPDFGPMVAHALSIRPYLCSFL